MTNRAQGDSSDAGRSPRRYWMMTALLPLIALTLGSSACVGPRVVSADRSIQRLEAGKNFIPDHDGWFVPDAVWIDINDALGDKLDE